MVSTPLLAFLQEIVSERLRFAEDSHAVPDVVSLVVSATLS